MKKLPVQVILSRFFLSFEGNVWYDVGERFRILIWRTNPHRRERQMKIPKTEREVQFMGYLITILVAYVMGSSNMAKYLAMIRKVDLQAGGSGNLGASNAVILMGWGAGVLTALHDIGKSALAVILARTFFPDLPHIGAVAGVASVLGHIYPFWMKFKGGKGFASYLGMTIALNWKFAIVVLLLVVVVTLLTDYIVAGTTTTIVLVPVYMGIAGGSVVLPLILLVASAVIAWKHRENYVRIYKGTEIGFRSAGRGDHRVK